MTIPLPLALQPGVVNSTISQIKVFNTRLQDFFIGGGGVASRSGRNFAWDIFNDSREAEMLRAPGTPPSRIAPQAVGNVAGAFPRAHSSLPLIYEEIHNQRKLGGLELDRAGESYILKQERYLAQRYANLREFMFLAMTRGKLYYTKSGDDLTLSLTSGTSSIDYQVPAGNKNQLNVLGTGAAISATWDTTTTDIPNDIAILDGYSEVLTGRGIAHAWCNGYRWMKILANTKVAALSGTANVVFDRYERVGNNDFIGVIKGLPWITWHITNGVVRNNGTDVALFGNEDVMFTPEPDPEWVQWGEGSEIVIEYPGATPMERFGAYFWAEPTNKPAGYELTGVMNALPFLYNPNCIFIADVVP